MIKGRIRRSLNRVHYSKTAARNATSSATGRAGCWEICGTGLERLASRST